MTEERLAELARLMSSTDPIGWGTLYDVAAELVAEVHALRAVVADRQQLAETLLALVEVMHAQQQETLSARLAVVERQAGLERARRMPRR